MRNRPVVALAAAATCVAVLLSVSWPDWAVDPPPATGRLVAVLPASPVAGEPAATGLAAGGRGPAPQRLAATRQGRRAAHGRQPARVATTGDRFLDVDALATPPGEPVALPDEAARLLRQRTIAPAAATPALEAAPTAQAGDADRSALPWTADQLLADPTHMNDEYVALAVSPPTGNLFAVFAAYDLGGTDRDIYIARSLDLGQSWTAVKLPSFSLDESMPDLAIDALGYLYVVWVRDDGALLRVRSSAPEDVRNWAYVQAFMVGQPVAVPSIAVTGSGDFARLFIACSWYTINWSWYQYEYTLLWLYSTNGGQTVAYDYLEPDGYQDLWPVVAMSGGTVFMVNGELDPGTGRIRILAAADALSGSFVDFVDLTQTSPMSHGFPSVAADGPRVYMAYQLDWDDGLGNLDGDIIYAFSWDGLATVYGPYAMMATTSESVGPQIFARGGLVSCVWLEAPSGGDEFHLAARLASFDGHPDHWGDLEQVTDLPMVVPQYRAAAGAIAGPASGGGPAGPVAAVWMDRRDFPTQGFNIYASLRSLLPDLAMFTPSGWQSPLVVSMVPGQREDGPLAAGYPAYASLALANVGLAAAPGPVAVELRRGSALVGAWTVAAGLPAGTYAAAEDHPLELSAGLHTLTLRLDPDGLVAESDESNNELSKDVWVQSGDPRLVLAPASLELSTEPDASPAKSAPLALRRAAAGPVLEARLAEVLAQVGAGERLRVVVTPSERPDPADLARHGRRTAQALLAQRAEEFAARLAGKAARPLRAFWLSGEAAGLLTRAEIEVLAAEPTVGRIWLDDRLSEAFAGPAARTGPSAAWSAGGPFDAAATSVPWHLQMLGAPDAWALGLDGSGILVGHTDSGVAWDHPDLVGRLWDGGPEYPHHGYDFLDDDTDPYDPGSGGFWHGTHTAGLVVGAGHGVAPGARLLVTRCVPGYYADLVAALQFCLDHGCHLITTSAGWTAAGDALRSANRANAEIMLALGVPWITAAGNGDNQGGHLAAPLDISSPADSPDPWYGAGGHSAVIAVGAVTQAAQIWSSSSRGPTGWNIAGQAGHDDYPYPPGLIKPDVVAPGVEVVSTVGGGGYAAYSGTSMAAPLVAGAAAILMQANPTLAVAELAEVLATTSEDLGPAGRDNQYGAGLVDLPAAIAALPTTTAAAVWVRNEGVVPLLIASITAGADWLAPVPAAGTVAPGDSLRVTVVWDAAGLATGIHRTDIVLTSNDPASPALLPVTLAVGRAVGVADGAPVAAAGVTCYPNPFNPGTTVSFALARSGPVAVRVFDARGRLVRALLDGQSRPAGRHEIAWDGRDAAGQACASGVYLVRVDAGGPPQTGRMLLVR